MSHLRKGPSPALLRSLRRASAARDPGRAAAALNSQTIRLASTDNEGRNFKGQMMESIGMRLAREKAERERIQRERIEGASRRNAATTFGERIAPDHAANAL